LILSIAFRAAQVNVKFIRPRGEFGVADGQPGAVTMKIRDALLGIQQGTAPDPHGWMQPVA
jgi:hypothetical protein